MAENEAQLAWHIGLGGLFLLEVAREKKCAVFTPSSIGAFGDDTPKTKLPKTRSSVPKQCTELPRYPGELLGDCYFKRFGVDTRSVRFPGLISNA